MTSEISEEELDKFLIEAGILPNSANSQIEKDASLDSLLDEIINTIATSPSKQKAGPIPSISEKKNNFVLSTKEKQKHVHLPFFPLLISIAFLGGIFLGSIFGFYWGKTHRTQTLFISSKEIDNKISLLINQIQEMHDIITSNIPISADTPVEEIIEPVPESELENLMLERVM